jgi:hypothetical protein
MCLDSWLILQRNPITLDIKGQELDDTGRSMESLLRSFSKQGTDGVGFLYLSDPTIVPREIGCGERGEAVRNLLVNY